MKNAAHNNTGQDLADNLNRNVILEHIEMVEQGKRPNDADYYKFIKFRRHLASLPEYQKWKYGKSKRNLSLLPLLGTVAILLLGGLFYWFELRPANIRTACAQSVRDPKYQTLEDANNHYRFCLAVHGLKPE